MPRTAYPQADRLPSRRTVPVVCMPAVNCTLSCPLRPQVGLHCVERYSVASNQWVEKAMIADHRFAFCATFINEGVYVSGGHIYCNDTLTEDCGNRCSRPPYCTPLHPFSAMHHFYS